MFRPRSIASFAVLVLVILTTVGVFLPWVEAGLLDGADYVNGIDIPVLGWSILILSAIGLGVVLLSTLHGSPWLWLLSNFFIVLLTTVLGLCLLLMDVVDSAVVKWVVKALPEQVQESTPTLSASFGLWAMFLVALVAAVVTGVAAIGASRHAYAVVPEIPVAMPSPFPVMQQSSPGYTPPTGWWDNPN